LLKQFQVGCPRAAGTEKSYVGRKLVRTRGACSPCQLQDIYKTPNGYNKKERKRCAGETQEKSSEYPGFSVLVHIDFDMYKHASNWIQQSCMNMLADHIADPDELHYGY
jgi:hypothetical protein